jgi:hypothetical protein
MSKFPYIFFGVFSIVLTACGGSEDGSTEPAPTQKNTLNAGIDISRVYGDTPFLHLATGGNGSPVTYSSSDEIVALIDQDTSEVTILQAGSAVITVSQPASNGVPAKSDEYILTIAKAVRNILEQPDAMALSSGDNGVTFEYQGGNNGEVGLSSSNVGVLLVDTASEARRGIIDALTPGSASIKIQEADSTNYLSQSVSFNVAGSAVDGNELAFATDVSKLLTDPVFTQPVIGGNLGQITFSFTNTNVATVDAQTGAVTIVGAGTSIISATEAAAGCFET